MNDNQDNIQTVRFDELTELIEALPDSVHLTFIGGQALSFWYEYFLPAYPDILSDYSGYVGTRDVDFMTKKESMQICADAWGVDLKTATLNDHASGQIGVMEMSINGRSVIIDFLTDYVRSGPIKDRYKQVVALSDTKNIFVLDTRGTLLSKISNTLTLHRRDDHSLGQIRTAMAIVSCAIREAIEDGNHREACRLIRFVFDIRKSDWYGRRITSYDIELIDLFPENVDQLDDTFLEKTFKPEIQRITGNP